MGTRFCGSASLAWPTARMRAPKMLFKKFESDGVNTPPNVPNNRRWGRTGRSGEVVAEDMTGLDIVSVRVGYLDRSTAPRPEDFTRNRRTRLARVPRAEGSSVEVEPC